MSKLKITSVGHATHLIEMDGDIVLTDPNFSKKVLFAKRLKEPGIRPENLPSLTLVAITHAHYSHLDFFSFKYIPLSVPVVAPRGLGKLLQKFLRNPILEIAPGDAHTVGGLKVYAVPVKHHGFRLSGLRYRAAAGFVFEKNGRTVFFPGDTAYGDHLKKIASLHKIDVALLPIGSYAPAFFMKRRHMNPSEALDASLDLKAGTMIPYHYGVFHLSKEDPEAPIEWMRNILKEKSYPHVKILDIGENLLLEN